MLHWIGRAIGDRSGSIVKEEEEEDTLKRPAMLTYVIVQYL